MKETVLFIMAAIYAITCGTVITIMILVYKSIKKRLE